MKNSAFHTEIMIKAINSNENHLAQMLRLLTIMLFLYKVYLQYLMYLSDFEICCSKT